MITRLRRYPVKSMAGEDLAVADLDDRGIVGDRWFAVRDSDGRFASGKNTRRFRRHDEVFEYAAATTGDTVRVTHADGSSWPVGSPELDTHLSTKMGQPVAVTAEGAIPHQDMGALSLVGTATLRWCAERWGVNADPRRLRVNLVVDTAEPFVEESWVGRGAVLGSAAITFDQRVPRCRMIDINQDEVVATGQWLKPLTAERDMFLAVYADVARPGRVCVGDHIRLTEPGD